MGNREDEELAEARSRVLFGFGAGWTVSIVGEGKANPPGAEGDRLYVCNDRDDNAVRLYPWRSIKEYQTEAILDCQTVQMDLLPDNCTS